MSDAKLPEGVLSVSVEADEAYALVVSLLKKMLLTRTVPAPDTIIAAIQTLKAIEPAMPGTRARLRELEGAAQAVVDRWDTSLWKDAEPTAAYIERLRRSLAGGEGE